MPIPPYQFDPTGVVPANRIINEIHTVTVANAVDSFVIVPDAGPFYADGLTVVNSSGVTLQENVDYYLTHPWTQASTHTGKPVFGTLTLINGYPIGNYRLNYQTIGGEYVANKANAIQSGLVALANQYVAIDWTTAPTAFPAIPHTENLSALGGMTNVYQALYAIATAIRSPEAAVSVNDIVDFDNFYVESMVSPLIETMTSVALNSDNNGKAITSLMTQLWPTIIANKVPNDLSHYAIKFFGFTIRVGHIYFELNAEPPEFIFPDNGFLNQCAWVDARMCFADANVPLLSEYVQVGPLSKTGFKFKPYYDPSLTEGTRLLTYIAIGL